MISTLFALLVLAAGVPLFVVAGLLAWDDAKRWGRDL